MKASKLLLIILLLLSSLNADEDVKLHFNHFGNIGYSQLNKEGFSLGNYYHDSVTSEGSFSPYSKLGLQLGLHKDKYSFIAQALIRKNEDKYEPELTWLNLKYTINNNFSIRLGRNQVKILANSDSIDIDYLYLWVTPPKEVYGIAPIRTYDGVELVYENTYNEYNFDITFVLHGEHSNKVNYTTSASMENMHIENMQALKINVEDNNLQYSFSLAKSKLSLYENPQVRLLVDALESYGNNMQSYTLKNMDIKNIAFGLKYTKNDFIFESEIVRLYSDGFIASSNAGYVLLGHKWKKWTPYIMYAKVRNDKEYFNTDKIQVVDALSASLKQGLIDSLYFANYSQETSSLGLRYDASREFALKFQVSRIKSFDYGNPSGLLMNTYGYERGGFLSRMSGVRDTPVYEFSLSISYAY